jgi:EAL domain-containing protein (putative c-di-GMP-specific phosphodiesterase class I)
LIVSIGRWVIDTACAQSAAWQRAGLPPTRIPADEMAAVLARRTSERGSA